MCVCLTVMESVGGLKHTCRNWLRSVCGAVSSIFCLIVSLTKPLFFLFTPASLLPETVFELFPPTPAAT